MSTTSTLCKAVQRRATQRRLFRLLALVVALLLLAGSCSGGESDGQRRTEVAGELPIPGSERSKAGSAPGDPTIVGDLELPDGVQERLEEAPEFEDLAKKYPDAVELIQSSDLESEEDFDAVYDELLEIYEAEGSDGLHQFMLGTGLLQGLGLDAVYTDLALAYEDGGWENAKVFAAERGLVNDEDELRVLLELESNDYSKVEPELGELDVRVVEKNGKLIEGGIKLDKLESLGSSNEIFAFMASVAQLPDVVKVKFSTASVTSELVQASREATLSSVLQQRAGVAGEGPAVTGADNWHTSDLTGDGVKIGVIDPDGFRDFDRLLGTELPPSDRVTLMPGLDAERLARSTGIHGTACAEIITEMAPNVELFIAHSTSVVAFANAIDWMIESEVDIISYSAGRPSEPIDGTSPSGTHVQRAIDEGILWVNSTGNFGLSHLDMTYTDTDGNGYHEFPNGAEVLPTDLTAEDVLVSLVWDDPWVASQSNYDLELLQADANGRLEVIAASRNIQAGSQGDNPTEQIAGKVTGTEAFIAIRAPQSSAGSRLNLLGHGMDFQYSIPEGSVTSPADLDAVLSVGATNWEDGILEPYSSQGPTWDGRLKPNLVAPSRVSSASFGGQFFGTSASAPHVAGAAALVLQQHPDATEGELRQALSANTLDQEPEGIDNKSGNGNLNMGDDPSEFRFLEGLGEPGSSTPQAGEEDPAAVIESIDIAEVSLDGETAIQIDLAVTISNLEDQEVQVAAFFFFDTGRNIAVKDFNGRYASQKNTVAVGEVVEPSSDQERIGQLRLLIPMSELHLASGERFELKVTTSVSSELAWADYLAISDWQRLAVET